MSKDREAVIVSGARTAIGKFQGALGREPAPRLGAAAIEAAVQRAGIAPARVEEVIMGCVLSAGVGQAPARQAALHAGIPDSVEMPAPVKATMRLAEPIMFRKRSISSMAPSCRLASARSGRRRGT